MAVKILYKAIRSEEDGTRALTSLTVPYRVDAATDEAAARAQLQTSLPSVYEGLPLAAVRLVERLNATIWEFEAEYRSNASDYDDNTEDEDPTVIYSCSSRKILRKEALSRIDIAYASGVSNLPQLENKRSINITEDGVVEGVEVDEAEMTVQYHYYHRRSKITAAYMITLAEMVGKVNNAAFKGFPVGSLKFNGMDCSVKFSEKGRVPVTYNFSYSPTVQNYPVADGIRVNKYGWDYLWQFYQTKVDETTGNRERKVLAWILDRVAFFEDFSKLGIGE